MDIPVEARRALRVRIEPFDESNLQGRFEAALFALGNSRNAFPLRGMKAQEGNNLSIQKNVLTAPGNATIGELERVLHQHLSSVIAEL